MDDDDDDGDGMSPLGRAVVAGILAGLVLMLISRALPPVPANDNAVPP